MAGKKWSSDELEFVKNNFIKMSCSEMAGHLNRTTRSVQHVFNELGLKRPEPQVGDKFNRLTIKEKFFEDIGTQKRMMVKCICDCGRETIQRLTSLVQGTIKSCKCLKQELARDRTIKRNYQHGMCNTKLHKIWNAMKARCRIGAIGRKNYYDKGITVCKEWEEDFNSFYNWASSNGYKDGLTIDRINNNIGYNPENCRWATVFEQNNNKSSNILITAFGETKSVTQWSKDKRCKCTVWSLNYRIKNSWNPETAISTPIMNIRHMGEPKSDKEVKLYTTNLIRSDFNHSTIVNIFNENKSIIEWSKDIRCKVNYQTFVYRLKVGWEPEKALTLIFK